MRNKLVAGAIGLALGVLSMGVADGNIGYFGLGEHPGINQGVYAGWNAEHCVGYEFKPVTGFFVGCE